MLMTLMTFSLLCNKQSGGQTPGLLTIDHICKDARSRPLIPVIFIPYQTVIIKNDVNLTK